MKFTLFLSAMLFIGCVDKTASITSVEEPEIKKENIALINNFEPSDILMIVSDTGGLVADNNITGGRIGHSELVITRDGRYSTKGDTSEKKKGILQISDLNDLIREINNADFTAWQSKENIGHCPSDRDEKDRAYAFYTPTGIKHINACETIIDANSALFIKVFEILTTIDKQQ